MDVLLCLAGDFQQLVAVGATTRPEAFQKLVGLAAQRVIAQIVEVPLVHGALDDANQLALFFQGAGASVIAVQRDDSEPVELQPAHGALHFGLVAAQAALQLHAAHGSRPFQA
jgi:hypothetical protein